MHIEKMFVSAFFHTVVNAKAFEQIVNTLSTEGTIRNMVQSPRAGSEKNSENCICL